jgi:glutamate dehydrogenase (NADP+)
MAQVEAKNPNEPELYKLLGNLQRLLFHLSAKKNMTAKIYFKNVWTRAFNHISSSMGRWQREIQVNRGFRIQMNSAIGPYKGGICFSL